ncbi:hypothetical protein BBO99_00005669 [Phytophthora kernoviae]|uniref:Fcf2 pre-rRNA processing C-terminal domain-containing protein n=1 Tax=Phytophthora kernoviae TaxID=325452 RepID=A0A3R7HHL4_9STRA|nr:hypothetical protein JM16_005387 [Phytophthora kernoviae]RLN20568.1 hypothetical protein BBI17_005662 [Phytophthora kernoviae]RLN78860.1 hypothetical protein BBO99_00005669 [Phytophthora kernoviae]
MVETRRTSRRLQAKALAAASPSPSKSPAHSPSSRSSRKSHQMPSPSNRADAKTKAQAMEQASDESAQEIPLLYDDDEEEEDKEKKQHVVVIESSDTEEEQQKEIEEVEEEEIMLLDEEDEEDQEEEERKAEAVEEGSEDDEDEDVNQFAFLAASGLNLSTTSSNVTVAPSAAARPKSQASTVAQLKRRLVPNQLDSGASQYKNFFDFKKGKNSNVATLRADARAAEEASVVARGQKVMAHSERQRAESQRKKSAGRRWFNFESEEMTADARRDFALLKMRNYLDPKKFYKSSDHSNGLPKHFQMGVVIEGAHEFHSARLTKKQRRQTFTDEIMADEAIVQYTHRVASNIQKARSNQGRPKKKRRNY